MFDPTILLWPGVGLAALSALALASGRDRRDYFWGYDLMGGVGIAGGGLLIYESQRAGLPTEIEAEDLFMDIFDGWPQAVLLAVIAAAALLVAVIIVRRALPSWQRAVAVAGGSGGVVVLSHLWSTGL